MGCRPGKLISDDVQHTPSTNSLILASAARVTHDTLEGAYFVDRTRILGMGLNGAVCLATHKRTNQMRAVKHIWKGGTLFLNKARRERFRAEINIYLQLDHPHIARLVEVFETTWSLTMVMEYCSGGELLGRLQAQQQFGEEEASELMRQMMLAVQYLHSHGVVHRDLKLENWLYEDDSVEARLKLIDFGFSTMSENLMRESLGSIFYVAPEVLQASEGGEYTGPGCDMWSLGAIAYMLLAGHPPFYGGLTKTKACVPETLPVETAQAVIECTKKGVFTFNIAETWGTKSQSVKDFISKLLVVDPAQRMSADQALRHTWLMQGESYQRQTTPDKEETSKVLASIREYSRFSKMKRATISVMAYSLDSSELKSLHDIFLSLDKENSGTITLRSLCDAMFAQFEISGKESKSIFEAVAGPDKKEIRYTEFVAAALQLRFRENEGLVRETFRKFDKSGNGHITESDLRQILGKNCDDEDLATVLKGSTTLDYELFISSMEDGASPMKVYQGHSPNKDYVMSLQGASPMKVYAALVDVVNVQEQEQDMDPMSPKLLYSLKRSRTQWGTSTTI